MELTEARLKNCADDLQECRELMVHWWTLSGELLVACEAAKLYLDWGWGQLGPNAVPPGYPELLEPAIAKAHAAGLPAARRQGGEEEK